jgi:hypothetical protein
MRAEKRSEKRSDNKPPAISGFGVVLAVASHAAMGVALGLVFALILTRTPFFGVLALIDLGTEPKITMTMFVGTTAAMFGIGAALTGAVLMMEDA